MVKSENITAAGISSAVAMLQDHIEEAPTPEIREQVIKLGELLQAAYYAAGANLVNVRVSA